MKALLKTRMRLNDTARSYWAALLQRENIDGMVKREARGWIRRWKRTGKGEGKAVVISEASLEQVAQLRWNAPLNAALLRVERTNGEWIDGGELDA